jgi:hypothetical protein
VSDRGGDEPTETICQPAPTGEVYQPLTSCAAGTEVPLAPHASAVCDHGMWTRTCRHTPDCPAGMGCDGSLCRALCDEPTGAGCGQCGFGCVSGLCVPS